MYKMLKVEERTHRQIKTQASAKGMTISEYVQYIADLASGGLVKVVKDK